MECEEECKGERKAKRSREERKDPYSRKGKSGGIKLSVRFRSCSSWVGCVVGFVCLCECDYDCVSRSHGRRVGCKGFGGEGWMRGVAGIAGGGGHILFPFFFIF